MGKQTEEKHIVEPKEHTFKSSVVPGATVRVRAADDTDGHTGPLAAQEAGPQCARAVRQPRGPRAGELSAQGRGNILSAKRLQINRKNI